MPSRPSAKKNANIIDQVLSPTGIVILLLIIAVISGIIYFSTPRSKTLPGVRKPGIIPTSTPKPTPTAYPLPQGPQTYPFGYGSGITGPKPSQITIAPYDPKNGEKQTFTVNIKYEKPITYAAIILKTDNKEKTYPLARTKGTDAEGSVWEVTITTDDTHLYVYDVGLDFRSGSEKTNIMPKLTLRAY